MIFLFTCFRFKNFCMLNENGRLGLEGGRRDLSSENKFSKLKLVIVFLADANFFFFFIQILKGLLKW